MHGATMYLEGEVKERTPAAHGTLKQSISSEVHELGDAVIGVVGSPLAYAVPVELGTRPHFPPVDAIEDWVNVKLGMAGPEARAWPSRSRARSPRAARRAPSCSATRFDASRPSSSASCLLRSRSRRELAGRH
jgi:hypothetical protein